MLESNVDVNKETSNMAASYAAVAKSKPGNIDEQNSVKPVFILESDVFGELLSKNPHFFFGHIEVYKAINRVFPASHLQGLQRVRGLWRIYPDSNEDRETLLIKGLDLRKRYLQVYTRNPRVVAHERPENVRIRIKNIPCSAEDGQIHRYLETKGCKIHSYFRERLRVDSQLTNCQTGDRIFICDPPSTPLPRSDFIGKYKAAIIHKGQPFEGERRLTCNKCLEPGHKINECHKDWKCRSCGRFGHKVSECDSEIAPKETENNQSQASEASSEEDTDDSGSETDDHPEQSQSILQTQTTDKTDKTPRETVEMRNEPEKVPDIAKCDSADVAPGETRMARIAEASKTNDNTKSVKKRRRRARAKEDTEDTTIRTLDQFLETSTMNTPDPNKQKKSSTTPTNVLHDRTGQAKKSKY